MMKQAWRSYLASLHPRNIKKLREKVAYGGIYLFVLGCYIFSAVVSKDGYMVSLVLTLVRFLPLFVNGYSALSSQLLMPKAMFLSPMKEEERREYINCVLTIKIGMSVVFSFVIEVIWSLFAGVHLWRSLVVVFIIFSLGVALHICEEHKRENGISTFVGMLLLYFLTCRDSLEILNSGWIKIVLDVIVVICLLLLAIFNVKIMKEQFVHLLEQGSEYEMQYKIKGKAIEPQKFDMFANKKV